MLYLMAMAIGIVPTGGDHRRSLRPAKIKLGDPNAPGPVKLIVPSLRCGGKGNKLCVFFERSLELETICLRICSDVSIWCTFTRLKL